MTGLKNVLKTIKFHCKCTVVIICKVFVRVIPKNKKLILCSSWFGKKYLDSPRYMYEYLLWQGNYEVFWFTKNRELYETMKSIGAPVIYAYSLQGIWKQIKANVLISSVEFYDFNICLFSGCILLDLNHGFPIKQSGFEIPTYKKREQLFDRLLRWNVRMYKTCSSEFVRDIIVRAEKISLDRIVFCNKPRMDAFYDEALRKGNNTIVDKLKAGHKALVYMPTHRMAGKKTIDVSKIFDLDKLQSFCEENDAVFLIKKHYYHIGEECLLDDYSRIFDITGEDIEVQTLLYQADALISDYSASYIDYLMLDRPIVFYAYDFDDFTKNERGLYIKFEDIDAGYKPVLFSELMSALLRISADWKDSAHAEGRERMRKLYFDEDLPEGETRADIYSIIGQLSSGIYKSKWQ